ncbi:hypothetical protein LCGC14_1742550 [marine sediment metagenome]|uniref:HTH luxR-type domain-containing protein n=1 Tax=marine sediment metagenome TaxID=412755 RepID=A0A0F9K5Y3_9ZZZZ
MDQSMPMFTDREWDGLAGSIPLSARQFDISRCLFRGLGDKQIAQELGISMSTVRTHMSRLFDKAGTQDRVGYILFLTNHFLDECRKQGCPHRQ